MERADLRERLVELQRSTDADDLESTEQTAAEAQELIHEAGISQELRQAILGGAGLRPRCRALVRDERGHRRDLLCGHQRDLRECV
ncbi:MAG: hypothetical protein M3O70_16725 [Actinomycetota bacterium]|nr:hypothetical protein [Actinomycetota bacterium]